MNDTNPEFGSNELPEVVPAENTPEINSPMLDNEQDAQMATERPSATPPPVIPDTGTIPITGILPLSTAATDAQATSHSPSYAQPADDLDLIEKEWVSIAKNIIRETHDDPRLQNEKLAVVKADYVKKRYNKDIKLSKTS